MNSGKRHVRQERPQITWVRMQPFMMKSTRQLQVSLSGYDKLVNESEMYQY